MNWNLLRVVCLAAALAVLSLADAVAYAASQPYVLPTGATITPDAAPGAVFQTLTVNLPDYPDREVDGAQTTALSPDGKTLLILTSGFNKLRDANGAVQPQDSSSTFLCTTFLRPACRSRPRFCWCLELSLAWYGVPMAPDSM